MNFITTRVKRDFLDSLARIRRGSLRLITPEGEIFDFGQGLPEAEMQIHDWSVVTALAARGDIGWGETYVAGLWDSPSIDHLTQVALMNRDELTAFADPSPWSNFKFRAVDRILRANSKRGAKRNIKAHYDVGNEFYQLWLDDSMTYSSALFAPGDNDLLRAQARKYDRILERSKDAERILEVGCGWGGFAERAADQGRHVTGITISPSQHGFADARLDGRADIQLRDYRDTEGKFDAIVSIEMIEAVGERYWPQYFHMLKSRLREGGRAIVQAITVEDSYFDIYRRGSDYIRQYTFPGGMLLSDAMIAHHARKAGLEVKQSFKFGQDYGRTCAMWSERLHEVSGRVQKLGYDQTFLRNWQFYLQLCAGSFVAKQTDVVQVELAHAH
ncbi:Cyclopropane-fatty-acyl-phospholipid synthase [Tritonibacter multivorans]|uniref:Cyclopropane-fatty-acyl-phospholipid synthase n=1 Tax=Tritonibacter multivorans TaxID=928856 RepID=A0A0P1G807_9RHOB|nr:cyclopropane-fatty-acyl-phospholipid synthase family protein [Tritonibacter multivorans]MDA7422344.1 cyclopropane-fatty-acyl-phospholipid synthase [Tritonibacter multivorans]CUH77707.1 Cyclopropane-fatty-acyl-phospholipid synthase [Tritonibacter multivorans]SFD13743.1 cyclopropane-fatty-acyl-phospholipid synthase [Tritonibacter multivorans]